MIIDYYDGTTPMLSSIMHISREVAFEQMSKIGNAMRKNAGNRMRTHKHNWLQVSHNGRLEPYYSNTQTKELGQRTNKDGGVASPDSMSAMISSFLMEKSGTLVVGGLSPRHIAIKRKDGKRVGLTNAVSAVGQHTQSIIHKLDTGERNEHHGWGSMGIVKQNPFFRDPRFKGRHFMQAGFNDSQSYAKSSLSSEYEKIVGKAINSEDIKQPVKRKKA